MCGRVLNPVLPKSFVTLVKLGLGCLPVVFPALTTIASYKQQKTDIDLWVKRTINNTYTLLLMLVQMCVVQPEAGVRLYVVLLLRDISELYLYIRRLTSIVFKLTINLLEDLDVKFMK